MVRVATYIRVSTLDQSTEMQRHDLESYLKARGLEKHDSYEDHLSGTTSNRPEFRRLQQDARRREFDVVLVWKLDRLFRSLRDLVNTLQEWDEIGVGLISIKDNIDLTTSTGRLMMHILGAFAQFEADLIRERVRSGLDNARRRGIRLGRPTVVKEVAQLITLRREGLSYRAIGKRLGVSKATVYKTLQRVGEKKTEKKFEIIEVGKKKGSVS